uniref:histidine kinase n=1 Tax=Candidatus Kentrum sp. FW TaxID=2126338 RepID=A0A450SV33_9GAMM|nr:MAG: Signal transduction histidine kinase [Candidatus Kentron sp. FW]
MRRNKKNPKWKQRPGEQTQTLKAAWQQLDDVNNLKSQIIESPRQGKPERAEQRLGYLRQNQGQPDLLAKSLCDLAQQIPQPDWKLALYEEAEELNPFDPVTLNSYATALANAGDTEKAFGLFERSLVVEPNDETTLLQFGLFLETQERYDEAIGQLERIRLATVDRRFAGFVCLNLGRLYYRIDEKNRAADWFERAVEYSDDAMASRLNAARNILALRPHSREAVAILQEIIEEMPGHGPALQMLHLNLGPKEQYEQFGRDDEGRDRELLNRAIYHKILNEVATLKMIAYRIVDEADSETLHRVIKDIDTMVEEIGRRRNATQAKQQEKDSTDYEQLLREISDTAQDIADFANNGIAIIKQRVYELLETPGDASFVEGIRHLLGQIELTEGALNDLKTVNESIHLDIAPFPVRDLFANWQQNPEIGNTIISVRMENPDTRFHGDEQKLKAILKELVDNSRKHNPDLAKLRIRMMSRDLGTLPNHVLPGKAPPGTSNYLNITYLDDGQGVPTDQKEWVFQPLKTTGRDGSGLGLFIIRKTVRAMRGYVLERGDTRGARFEIYLPYGAEKWRVR